MTTPSRRNTGHITCRTKWLSAASPWIIPSLRTPGPRVLGTHFLLVQFISFHAWLHSNQRACSSFAPEHHCDPSRALLPFVNTLDDELITPDQTQLLFFFFLYFKKNNTRAGVFGDGAPSYGLIMPSDWTHTQTFYNSTMATASPRGRRGRHAMWGGARWGMTPGSVLTLTS